MALRTTSKAADRLLPLFRGLAVPALIAIGLGTVAAGAWVHLQLDNARRGREVGAVTRELRNRLSEANLAWSLVQAGRPVPEEILVRLGRPDQISAQAERGRALLEGHPADRLPFDRATRAALLAAANVRILLLSRLEPGRVPAASDQPLNSVLLDGYRSLEEVDRLADLDVASGERAGRRAEVLLAALLGLAGLLAWGLRRTRLQRDRHLEGARLVEDMLEAYGRRLESMNAELEQVNLLKTQFLANTSHELLTPLNGIMGSLELLRDGACGSPQEEREFLVQAYQSAERLLALIHDLLDLCRLEEGNLALRCRSVETGPLVDRAISANRGTIEGRGLTLLTLAPAEGWPRIQADPERLQQVMHHLIANAVKFTQAGSIRISGRVEREGRPPRLRVEIADTGIGIDPEKLPRVFDLFSQGDGSDTRRFGGTGLGLTLCRHLVQGMSGQIGIESEGEARGTRVWFTLPLARELQDAVDPAAMRTGDAASPADRRAA